MIHTGYWSAIDVLCPDRLYVSGYVSPTVVIILYYGFFFVLCSDSTFCASKRPSLWSAPFIRAMILGVPSNPPRDGSKKNKLRDCPRESQSLEPRWISVGRLEMGRTCKKTLKQFAVEGVSGILASHHSDIFSNRWLKELIVHMYCVHMNTL